MEFLASFRPAVFLCPVRVYRSQKLKLAVLDADPRIPWLWLDLGWVDVAYATGVLGGIVVSLPHSVHVAFVGNCVFSQAPFRRFNRVRRELGWTDPDILHDRVLGVCHQYSRRLPKLDAAGGAKSDM